MKFNRDIVTPYLVFIFLVVMLSGVMMFFHLLDDYTNVVHEFLGLAFASFAILHIITNWKSIQNYGSRRKLFFPSVVILFVSCSLIVIGKVKGNLERELLERMIQAPVCYSFKTLKIEYEQATKILRQHNIVIKDSLQSIEQIGIANKKSPDDIIELIYK